MEDFYELLGVSEDASADEIDRAWRERVRRYHPDVNDDVRANAQFKTLQTAHEVLTDGTERDAYDRLGHETYVRERLEGLPTARHPAADDAAGTDRSDAAGASRDGSDGRGPDDAPDRSDRAGNPEGGRGDAGAGGADDYERGRGETGTTEGSTRAAGASTTAEASTTAGSSTGSTEGPSARADATSTVGRRTRPQRPLAYGWAAVAVASAVYLFGLRAYLSANAAALSGAVPAGIASLLRSSDLVAPGTFVLNAAATGAVPPLAFAAGAVALAAAFSAVVASFGRGAAYLYVAGGVAPAAALGIGPVVLAPDGVILSLTVVLPAATAGLFLLDVGRELLGGP